MMRIAVSQRVDDIEGRSERRDALDQRWTPILESAGLTPVLLPNLLRDPQAWALELGIQGLLLTGGNDVQAAVPGRHCAPERDHSEMALLRLAQERRWPALGICRGLQVMNVYLGGSLVPLVGHVATSHVLERTTQPARLWPDLPASMTVNSFHGFGIAPVGLAASLVPLLRGEDEMIEAAEHRLLPWGGIMWHPERMPALQAVDRDLISTVFRSHD